MMRTTATALLLALAVSGVCSAAPQSPYTAARPDPLNGRFVAIGGQYRQAGYACSTCHQLDGTGDQSGAVPRISGQSEWYLLQSLQQFASGQRPSAVMTPVARSLDARDMQDVAAFYASVSGGPYPAPSPIKQQASVQQGERIATSGVQNAGVPACVSCHGPYGAGMPPLFPYLTGQYEAYLEYQLRQFHSGERGGPTDVMAQIASRLTETQIADVSAYFASLRPKEIPVVAKLKAEQAKRREGSASTGATRPPEQKIHLGATINPRPGKGDEVVPGASAFHEKR